ncbi:MAG: diguanylate cyclase [Oscillospiraceae bacterium]|nr:diguanylate cyclase [Oscillospiraceae bacterium]
MYNCLININISDSSGRLERVLSKAVPPEDCQLVFSDNAVKEVPINSEGIDYAAQKSVSERGNNRFDQQFLNTPDSVIIYGSAEDWRSNKTECAYSVLAAGEDIPDDIDLAVFDDVWLLPENEKLYDRLLMSYFNNFIGNVKERFDHRMLKICFDTAADSVPDLMWFKDMKGAHLMVNDAFCKAVEKTKQQIYKQGHYYIWDIPQEEYEQGDYVCLESEQVVIDAGKTVLLDENVKTKAGMKQFKTYKSPLCDIDGRVFGTCGVARDVTDLHKINSELTVMLESIPFAVMIEDSEGNLVSSNIIFKNYFPDIADFEGRDCTEWKTVVLEQSENSEISIEHNGDMHILKFMENTINDSFGEVIGNITIFHDITAERNYQKQTLKHANTDFLTGLHNRRSLFAQLSWLRTSPYLSMITIDLDNFKKVNDTFGHKAGDKALIETSHIISETFSDDFTARLGGDEFLVVISRKVSMEQLKEQTQKMLDTMLEHFNSNAEFKVLTASAGIVLEKCPPSGVHNAESLMHKSDSALYHAKNKGKACFVVYDEIKK